ncbi:MAG: erythromycin biosynthesis sensory transduction protein eryC1, partial [Blastocatellia bacterium]
RRRRLADTYKELLTHSDITLPEVQSGAEPVWHLFVVRVSDRERLQTQLKEAGIATGVHYPIPLHLQPAYEGIQLRAPLPVTEKTAQTVVSLPMYPELKPEQMESICNAVAGAFDMASR